MGHSEPDIPWKAYQIMTLCLCLYLDGEALRGTKKVLDTYITMETVWHTRQSCQKGSRGEFLGWPALCGAVLDPRSLLLSKLLKKDRKEPPEISRFISLQDLSKYF